MRLILMVLAFTGCFYAGFSQTSDRSLQLGYRTEVQGLRAAGPNRWLAALRGVPRPGSLFNDTLAVVVFDDAANIVLTHRPALPPSEYHYFHDVDACPDGGFVYSFESTLCDVVHDETRIVKVDSTGAVLWEFSSDDNILSSELYRLDVLPDGDVLGYHAQGGRLLRLDGATGSVEDFWELVAPGGNSPTIADFQVIPGSEDFVAIGYPHAQIWSKIGGGYELVHMGSLPPQTGPFGQLVSEGDSAWIFFDLSGERFYRFNISGNLSLLPLSPLPGVHDYAIANSGLVVLQRYGGVNTLTRFVGSLAVETYAMPDSSQIGYLLAARANRIGIAGSDLYGPELFVWNNDNAAFRAVTSAWLRTVDLASPGASSLPEVALTAVEQQTPVEVQLVQVGSDKYYTISGGNYRLEVTNQGAVAVDAFTLNFAAPRAWSPSICSSIPAEQRRFSSQGLAPGESVWIDWGNVAFSYEPEIPLELCFSVGSPNLRPDAEHADNTSCQALSVVHTVEPGLDGVVLSPNPVHDRFTIEAAGAELPGTYRLYNAAGQLVREETIAPGRQSFTSRPLDLPDGVYVLALGGWRKRLMISTR